MLNLTDISGVAEHPKSMFAGYAAPEPGCHDEAFDAAGQPRAHWRGVLDWLGTAGAEGYGRAALDLARLRTESGIAFTAQRGGPTAAGDALPIVLAAEDWAALEAGILQRARLAEAAVADVYTGLRTVSAGLIPPGLVFGGTAFAAHCAGWPRPPRDWLHVYEADVARTADGRWILLGDRLDAPLGDGWLLANRIATSQALADPFVAMGVRRLASHFSAFQEHLERMMGWEGRLVLLTGGEKDPRFFSHAYLARYIGATLVELADLTVRGGAAFLKTLDGLKRVDVMVRGVPDAMVDILHRPGHAASGAPALSLAARSGSLKISNAIGSAVFAHRALSPYAHRLAEVLLGEDLLLSDAPCLWLGTAAARTQVLAERDQWRIEHLTDEAGNAAAWDAASEDGEAPEETLARSGERYCAVLTPPVSRTPVWRDGAVRPAEWMMRVFACRTADGWSLAPGGVASPLAPNRAPAELGFGKDVWVLPDAASARLPQVSGLLTRQFDTAHMRRTGSELPSRVADEVFWLGRNAERAEQVLRVLGLCLSRHLDGNPVDADPTVLARLIEIHADRADDLDAAGRYADAVRRLTSDEREASSIPAILRTLRSGALRARASISAESWRYIDRLCSDERWQARDDTRHGAALAQLIEDSLQALAAFAGSAHENLTRNYAWRFLEMGRRIERGAGIAEMAHRLAGRTRAREETYLRAWLTLSDSAMAYRSRYMMTAQANAVIDLLVLDETNPRSLAYQVARLEQVLAELPTEIAYRRPDHRRALALLTAIRLRDAEALAAADPSGTRRLLVALAARCQADLAAISDLIGRAFFAHADAPEALLSQARREDIAP